MSSNIELYDIEEPTEENAIVAHTAIGIDLGTTYSLVAISKDEQTTVIPDENGDVKLPSVVKYLDESVQVGESLSSADTIISAKRWMNKDEHKISTKQGDKTAIEISAEILKTLKERAEKHLQCSVEHAVITVPAYFNDKARNATKEAAKIAGLNVLRLINEPTAAAYAYGLEKKAKGTIAVYDLGGGTFDISILKIDHGIFRVIATAGDINLGGDNFDEALKLYLIEQYAINVGNEEDERILLIKAREIKEHLSNHTKWSGDIKLTEKVYSECEVGVGQFENIIAKDIQYTVDLLIKAMAEANIEETDLDALILVGGSTRIPYIKHYIEQILKLKPLDNFDPDLTVVKGASIQASMLTVGSEHLLLDITPLTLGIEIMGEMVEPIINENTPIPVESTKTFTTSIDNQKNISIRVMQGKGKEFSDFHPIVNFDLSGIPAMSAGKPLINVHFRIDADGILTVTASEEHSHISKEVMINCANVK